MRKTMKKDISLFMVLMAVMSFVIMPAASYAQTTTCTEDQTCPSCAQGKGVAAGATWNIPVDCEIGAQESAVNPIFDWDSTYGYCSNNHATQAAVTSPPLCPVTIGTRSDISIINNKMILNICCCPDACDFDLGDVIGIEMQILTPGVYWASDCNVPAFAPAEPNCYGGGNTAGTNGSMYELKFTLVEKTSTTAASAACNLTDNHLAGRKENPRRTSDTFKISYYNNNANESPINPGGGEGTTRPKVLRTPTPYDGYQLQAFDLEYNDCELWVDVPAMQAFDKEITASAEVRVSAKLLVYDYSETFDKITPAAPPGCTAPLADYIAAYGALDYARPDTDPGIGIDPPMCQNVLGFGGADWVDDLVNGRVGYVDAEDNDSIGGGGCLWRWPSKFCASCEALCGCTKTVGVLCCQAAPTVSRQSCIYFPYVLSGVDGWMSGIGLSRICDPATGATPTVNLTLQDCDGHKYSTTLTPSTDPSFEYCLGTQGTTVDAMVSDLTWTPAIPADYVGQWVLRVDANFTIDGYQFNAGSIGGQYFGAGVLPRQGCECPDVSWPGIN